MVDLDAHATLNLIPEGQHAFQGAREFSEFMANQNKTHVCYADKFLSFAIGNVEQPQRCTARELASKLKTMPLIDSLAGHVKSEAFQTVTK